MTISAWLATAAVVAFARVFFVCGYYVGYDEVDFARQYADITAQQLAVTPEITRLLEAAAKMGLAVAALRTAVPERTAALDELNDLCPPP